MSSKVVLAEMGGSRVMEEGLEEEERPDLGPQGERRNEEVSAAGEMGRPQSFHNAGVRRSAGKP